MELLTVESVTREALKILNHSYNKQYRTQIGGNEYVHAARQIRGSKTNRQTSHNVHTQEARID